ncbi:MAG: polyamine ABC transporter ATP-binding protein [Gammaproteobacteria bacterium]
MSTALTHPIVLQSRRQAVEPLVRVERVSKRFGQVHAVEEVSLDIHPGEFFSILGPSGCGKTTLLRMLAGLERPEAGRIFIDGVDMTRAPPYERPVNMMFQSYALFPHMTVEQNVAFGLQQERMNRTEIRERVAEMLELVRMTPYARRKPDQLSGGQRQRVALARALAKHPKLLLLDEPLGALDRKLREHTRSELVNIQERLGLTFVMVTHDQDEAMTMSSRLAVMDRGRIVQVGAPANVYEHPATRFVAEFIGDVNIFAGQVTETRGGALVIRSEQADCTFLIEHGEQLHVGTPVAIALRPEKISAHGATTGAPYNEMRGTVAEIAYLGDISVYRVRTAGGAIVQVQITNRARAATPPLARDEEVFLSWSPASAVVLQE